jgi:hypothetical protein
MDDTALTFGWICTDAWLSTMADAMLDKKYEDPPAGTGDTNMYRYGRIGSVNVVINCLPEPPRVADAAHIAQNMTATFTGIKAIVMTGFGSGVLSAGTRLGDLVISPAVTESDRSIAQRAVYVLQREAGVDGCWLSSNPYPAIPDLLQLPRQPDSDLPDYPQLHYGNIGLESRDIQNEKLQDQLATPKSVVCFDTVAAGMSAETLMAQLAISNIT